MLCWVVYKAWRLTNLRNRRDREVQVELYNASATLIVITVGCIFNASPLQE